jgi:DNA-binding Lrp family transcriptional regulator
MDDKMSTVDALDRRLLTTLPDVTRPGVLELSRRLGIARGTVQARLDRLQASGVLGGFGPYVDLGALGFTVLAFTTLEIAQGQDAVVIAALARIPEVLEVHKTTGPGDLLCRIVARTNEHLHDVLEQVLATPGITRTTSVLALASPVLRPVAYALPDALLGDAG